MSSHPSPTEQQGEREISASALSQHVQALCALGEKLAGTEEERKACEYIMGALAEAGVKARVHLFEGFISHPIAARLTVTFPERLTLDGVGVSFGVSTPPEGFSADVVHVGAGTDDDYQGLDTRGKIVLVDKLPNPQRTVVALRHGAAGMICMSTGFMQHKMIVTPVWGIPGHEDVPAIPRIPILSVSGEQGDTLRRLCASGQMRATLYTENREDWMTMRLPVVDIPGKHAEYLLVGGHYCSWFDGATDNVSGNSCLIELAKLFARHQDQLEYGIRIAWWPGHSNGRYAGSSWYAETFWQDLYDNCLGYFNIDSPGVKGAKIYVPRHQMAEISAFNEACVAELAEWSTVRTPDAQLAHGRRPGKYVNSSRPSRAGDQSFWGVGLTSIGVYSMIPPGHPDRNPDVGGSGGAWWWHSIDDTVDKCDVDVLAQDTRLYWAIIFRLLSTTAVPYNFADTAGDYADTLREYVEGAGNLLNLAPLVDAVAVLRTKAAALAAALPGLEAEQALAATRLGLKLARLLNPVLYTSVEPFVQQQALGTRFLPELAPCLTLAQLAEQSWEFKFLRATLNRKLTKIQFTLRNAIALLEAWEQKHK